MDQSNEKTLYKQVYYDTQENLTLGFATTTALDINRNVYNPRFIRQYQWSLDDWAVIATFKFTQYACEPITIVVRSFRFSNLNMTPSFPYCDI